MLKIKSLSQNKLFLAFACGAFFSLAFAPFHFFVAAIISLSAFYFLLEKNDDKKSNFWLGFFYGFGYFLSGIYWVAISLLVEEQFFWLIPFALTLIPSALALYFAGFALTYKFVVRRFGLNYSYQKILIFAFFWLVFEVFRSNLFTGFPWNLVGYIWLFDVRFAQLASVFGIYGLSFFAVLISLFPVLFFKKNEEKISISSKVFAVFLAIFFVANFLYGNFVIDEKKLIRDESVKLRLVQGNIEQKMKWDALQKYQNFLKHIELTNSKSLDDISAVIWSETAVPYEIDDNIELLEKLSLATPKEGSLITGALRINYFDSQKSEISNAWNSVFVLNKNGVSATYDKHHLVPFGEYIPLQRYFSFIEKITDGNVGFSEGSGAKTIESQKFSFSPLICYEVIFSDEILDKKSRPDLLINLTNDAWFGKSSGPYQHLDISKMRSIEYGISMARVANTGITAFIDPFGRIVKQINLNEASIIDVVLIKNLFPNVYEKYGHFPLIIILIAMILLLIILKKASNVAR